MKRSTLKKLLSLMLTVFLLLPLFALSSGESEGKILRIYYQNKANSYDGLGLWLWGDVVTKSEEIAAWPDGRTPFQEKTENSVYMDVPIKEDAKEIGLLVIDAAGTKHTPEDVLITLTSPDMKAVFVDESMRLYYEDITKIKEGHVRVRYLNKDSNYKNLGLWCWGDVETPSEKVDAWPKGASELKIADDHLGGAYVDIKLKDDAKQIGFLFVNRESAEQTQDFNVDIGENTKVIYMHEGESAPSASPFIKKEEKKEAPKRSWADIDAKYASEERLGAVKNADGSYTLRLWAPSAQGVEVLLYDKENHKTLVKDALSMQKSDKQVWEITLSKENTGLFPLNGYFYHFRVLRDGDSKLVLDPYAKSMALWKDSEGEVGKAALLNPDEIGEALSYAQIPHYSEKEDAIIYEAHIRDFTVDPSIESTLSSPYGSFAAFAEKLDYIKELGVTHIQLLPVLSFYYVDESDRNRNMEYASEKQNYNWGYDPLSYFSLTGMYSAEPEKPQKRIEEFKHLVSEIHKRGMGVILDVVYNHNAKIDLLQDIEPDYYYFVDKNGRPKGSFGGGQIGSTHKMARKLIIDSLSYLSQTYKVDGFRFDMMGNLDAETIALAHQEVSRHNPQSLWVGEGWRTFNGDHGIPVTAADQSWMNKTDCVAVFSDEVRNELKSGFGCEGEARFLTGGKRRIGLLFDNLCAKPGNIAQDDPGDVLQYIAAHDNLTLHDVIAHSIRKDPKDFENEILRRQRLGNAYLLLHQGSIFLHSGQEYGRTKQFLHPDYKNPVEKAPNKSTLLKDAQGKPFLYPYFIHDSYDSSDAVNMFDWAKVQKDGPHRDTMLYTQGMIALRRSTDAFSYGSFEKIDRNLRLIKSPSIAQNDLAIAFAAKSEDTGDNYLVFVNADSKERSFDLTAEKLPFDALHVLADGAQAGTEPIANPVDVTLEKSESLLSSVRLAPLTLTVLKYKE